MKIIMHFYRDEQGRPRLLHAHDEVDAQQAAMLRWTVPSLAEATQRLNDDGYTGPVCAIMVDTDDRILRDKADGGELKPVRFGTLLPEENVCPDCSLPIGKNPAVRQCAEGCPRAAERQRDQRRAEEHRLAGLDGPPDHLRDWTPPAES